MTRKNPKPENITEEICEKEAEKYPLSVTYSLKNNEKNLLEFYFH